MNGDEATGLAGSLLTTLVALVVVLAIAWLTLRLWARLSGGRVASGGASGRVRIVQSVPVGTRERLVIARHGGSEYLLGVTAGGISVVSRTTLPAEEAESASSTGAQSGTSDGKV